MLDRNGRQIHLGDWVRAVPANCALQRTEKGRAVVGRVVHVPEGRLPPGMQWTLFGPSPFRFRAGVFGPQFGLMNHFDHFNPACAELVLKCDGSDPGDSILSANEILEDRHSGALSV